MGTLIWGLGQDYLDNKAWIENNFDISAYYDSDEKKIPLQKGISKEQLRHSVNQFDTILVTGDPPSIVDDLIENYGVADSRIKILFYELLKHGDAERYFYGESLEDAVLQLLLIEMGIAIKDVIYLEIGTNEPVRHNNSFSLYEMGAHGYLVDALPVVGRLAKLIRPKDRFINCAVSDVSAEKQTFYSCESSSYSSLNFDFHKQYENKRLNGIKEITVPVVGINELIDMCNEKPNVLLCDAEGYDEKIIKGINYNNNEFDIIMLETDHLQGNQQINDFFKKQGYRLFAAVKQNEIYYNTKLISTKHN